MCEIGLLYQLQGNLELAMKEYQKSLNIIVSLKGREHIKISTVLRRIGELYLQKKDY